MKSLRVVLIILLGLSVTFAQNKTKPEPKNPKPAEMKTQEDSVSYSIGQNIAANLKDPNMKINFDKIIEGIQDAVNGKSALIQDEMKKVLMAFNNRMMAKRSADTKAASEKNRKAGDEFLSANKMKEGVITLPSGLQYKVITQGTGASPKATDKVKVHYKGTLIDGRTFDSSYDRNEPAVFAANQVIKGWTEALQLMKVGDKWQLFIPADLAYGDNGAGEMIAPGSVLIFEVELLEIVN